MNLISILASAFIALTFLSLTGCQTAPPTKVSESGQREFRLLVDKTRKPIELKENTVILDARSSFDYGLNRVTNSLSMPWEALRENSESGFVMKDLSKAARKLALFGVQPDTPVVVVGYGLSGKGEAGWLAWTLIYLGLRDVQVGSLDLFRGNLTQTTTPPPRNVDTWKVAPRSDLEISLADFKKLALDPKSRLNQRIHIIDVRSVNEFLNKKVAKDTSTPDINAMNIEWKEFYTSHGRPNFAIRMRLEQLGLKANDRVILVSKNGVRSAAAAYSLMALGFTKVQNFTGGWNEYLSR